MWHPNRSRLWRAIAAIPVAVSLFGCAIVAPAEATLRYNHGYSCNGERIVVGHCRRDSDMPAWRRRSPRMTSASSITRTGPSAADSTPWAWSCAAT